MADLPSWDDLPDAPQASSSALPSWDDLPDANDEDEPSSVGSFARQGARSIGAGIGAGLGMVGGAALGTLTSPVTGPVGPVAGAIGGGAAGGMAGQAAEDWILDKLGVSQGSGQLSNAQQQKDIETNPLSSFAGGLAGNIAPSFGIGAGARVGARAIGAGIQGLLEGGQEAYRGEDLDPAKIGLAAGAGAVFAKPRGWLTNLEGRLGKAPAPEVPNAPVETPANEAKPVNSTLNMAEAPTESQIAIANRDKYPQGSDMWKAWDDHAADTAAEEAKADLQPSGQASKSAISNTSISKGTATEQQKVVDENVGTPLEAPGGAAMSKRVAARPSDPARDYRKEAPEAANAGATQKNTLLSTDTTHPDIAAAVETGPPPQPPGQAQPMPQEPEPPINTGLAEQAAPTAPPQPAQPQQPTTPPGTAKLTGIRLAQTVRNPNNVGGIVDAAIQHAPNRPIVETPMPSGANSSKDLNGPIYVDPSVPPELRPFVAVHETVEGALEATGMPYEQAHAIATQAEKQAVERAGGNWESYQDAWKEPLAKAAALPKDTVLPTDTASSPWEDIGKHYGPPNEANAQAPERVETGLAPKAPGNARVLDHDSPEFKAAAEAALQSKTGQAPILPKEPPAEEGPKGTIDNGGLMAVKRTEMPKGSLDDATKRLEEAIGKKAGFPPAAEEAISKSKARQAADDLKAGVAPQRTRDTVDGWLKDNPVTRLFSPASMGKGAEDAAGIIREASGINARQIAIASNRMEPMRALVNALPERARISFMKAVDTGKALDYLPQLKPLAETMRSAFASIKTELQNLHGMDKQEFVENFFPHMFKRDTGEDAIAADTFAKSWFSKQGSTASLHHRTFPTLQDGLNAGLKLASTDPIDVSMRYMGSMRNFIEAKNILQAGKDQGYIKTFKNSRMGASGNPEGDQIPFGYVPLKGRASTGPEGSLYAPADFAEIYNNYLDQGFRSTETGARLYNALQNTSNSVTALELGFSGYHAFTMAKEAIIHQVAEGLSRAMSGDVAGGLAKIGKSPAAPYTLAKAGAGPLKAYLDPGANISPELRKTVDLITRSGGRMQGFRQDPTYKFSEMGSFFTAWKRGALAQQLADAKDRIQTEWTGRSNTLAGVANTGLQTGKEMFRTVGRVMQTVAQPLFEHYIPALKNGAFTETLGEWLRNNPNATDAEQVAMARKIGDSVDNRFGEMVQSNIFWKAQLKQSMQLAMRSYSWNLGTVREIGGGAAKFASKGPGALNMKGNDYDPRAAYVVAMPIVVAAASSVYQFLKTGQMPSEPKDLLAGRTGGKTQSGTPERAMLPGYEKDVYGWFHDPKQEAVNKIATAPRLVWETLANKDYAGHPIADPRDPLLQRLQSYGAHVANSLGPISVKQMIQGEKHGSNITFPERATAIRPAPSWLQEPERIQHGANMAAKREMATKKKFEQRQESLYK